MNSSKRKSDMLKPTPTQKIDRENVDPLWTIENQQLQIEAEANSRLRQQITKESYADFAVQANIKDKITLLKQKAVQIAQLLESEKRKNVELNAIIRHMNFVRQEQKNIEASHRDDINYESIDNLFRKIKKSEYDLEQMFSKLNDLTSKNKERKSEVDTYRTQRVIDSGIFLKIEKEIMQSETQYKKLLIEKTRFEQEYRKNLQNYRKMKNDIEKEQNNLSKRQTSVERQDDQDQFFMNVPDIQHAVKFTEIQEHQSKRKSFMGSRNLLMLETKKQQHHQEVEYAVKRLFVETGLNSVEALVDFLFNIETINQGLYNQVNSGTDKICELHRQIDYLKQKKAEKTIKYYESQPELTKTEKKIREAQEIEVEIIKVDSSANKISASLEYFTKTNQIRQISKITGVEFPTENQVEYLEQYFSELEKKLSPLILAYSSFQEGLGAAEPKENRESDVKEETVEDLINKVKRMEESEKIMVKQDFRKQYEKILKSDSSNKGRTGKKKTTFLRKH